MNYKRINTVFAKALTAGKSGLFEIFLLICIERPELPVVRSYLTLLYMYVCVCMCIIIHVPNTCCVLHGLAYFYRTVEECKI